MQVLSFDVEEHWRIEAAARLSFDAERREYYARRVGPTTRWILEQLARFDQKATFYLVGELAFEQPDLVRDIASAGHEIASHGWAHQRVHNFTPEQFREDLRRSRNALEQVLGQPIVGFRAPTFSIVRQTAWALDVLAEEGFRYDSSIYPVRHDRYGVPDAPRGPFLAQGRTHSVLELPIARLDVLGLRLPAGGGGYFRLLPLGLLRWGLRQLRRGGRPAVAMLYFHPWEFDPEQRRLPLRVLNRFRTYVGLTRSRARLGALLEQHRFARARDVAQQVKRLSLPRFALAT